MMIEVYKPKQIIAGDWPLRARKITVLSGQNVVSGTVVGKEDTNNKYLLSLPGAIDGSKDPTAIMAEDVDATAGDKEGMVYITGEFDETQLTYGAGYTADTIRDLLHVRSIILTKSFS